MRILISIIAFLVGVAIASLWRIDHSLLSAIFFGGVVSSVYIYHLRHDVERRRFVLSIILCIVFVALGAMRFNSHLSLIGSGELPKKYNKEVTVEVVVIEPARVTPLSVRVAGVMTKLGEEETPNEKTLLILPQESVVSYGDKLQIRGKVERPEAFENDHGVVFDYPKFLLSQQIASLIEVEEFTIIDQGRGPKVREWLYSLRAKLLSNLQEKVSSLYAGLAGGVLLGDKNGLSPELKEAMTAVGVIHVAVFSGQNVAIFAAILFVLLGKLPQKLKVCVVFVSIVGLVLLSGAEPPAIRAGILSSLVLLGLLIHREVSNLRALLLAAFFMVFINPLALMYDVSFQLSFLAISGLLFVTPLVENVIEKYLPWLTEKWGIKKLVSATLGAQIGVLPLILHIGGVISIWAILANILILPVITPLMMLALFVAITSALPNLLSFIPGIGSLILETLGVYVVSVVNFFYSIGGVIKITVGSVPTVIIYVLLALTIYWLSRIFPPKVAS